MFGHSCVGDHAVDTARLGNNLVNGLRDAFFRCDIAVQVVYALEVGLLQRLELLTGLEEVQGVDFSSIVGEAYCSEAESNTCKVSTCVNSRCSSLPTSVCPGNSDYLALQSNFPVKIFFWLCSKIDRILDSLLNLTVVGVPAGRRCLVRLRYDRGRRHLRLISTGVGLGSAAGLAKEWKTEMMERQTPPGWHPACLSTSHTPTPQETGGNGVWLIGTKCSPRARTMRAWSTRQGYCKDSVQPSSQEQRPRGELTRRRDLHV